jgi:tricorn protease
MTRRASGSSKGYGVDPDIEVVADPGVMARGGGPQLDCGIEEVLKALKKNPPKEVNKPKYPLRAE